MTEGLYVTLMVCYLTMLGVTWVRMRKDESNFKKDSVIGAARGLATPNKPLEFFIGTTQSKSKPRLWKLRSSGNWICWSMDYAGIGQNAKAAYTHFLYQKSEAEYRECREALDRLQRAWQIRYGQSKP